MRRVEGSVAGKLPAFFAAEFTCTPILCRFFAAPPADNLASKPKNILDKESLEPFLRHVNWPKG
jgi:hypothetical protein